MGFLSPWFLGGLLAVGLPVYIHLLRQHRSEPIKFSSVMFLERRTQSSVKHRRLKYLALLALRLAVILLLALMFANPFIRRSVNAAGGGRKFVMVAVDNSFSMRDGDRLNQAKRAALDVVSGMGPGRPRAGNDIRIQCSAADTTDVGQSGTSARDSGNSTRRRTQLLRRDLPHDSFTQQAGRIAGGSAYLQRHADDFDAHPFAELAIPPSTRLQLHAVADRREPNWYVESVDAPRSIFQPKKVRIQALVAGAGTPATTLPVELVLNGKVLDTKQAKLGENGRATVEFYLPEAVYGVNRGEFESRRRIPSRLTITSCLLPSARKQPRS